MMRTPLSKVRGLGSAKDGTGEWILARLTALPLIFLTAAFIVLLIALNGRPHAEVVAVLASPIVAVVFVAAILLTTIHMRLGMQVIIEDYVHAELPKLLLLAANWIFAWGIGLISVFATLKIAFGA